MPYGEACATCIGTGDPMNPDTWACDEEFCYCECHEVELPQPKGDGE